MNIFIKWLISALALLIVSAIIPGIVVQSLYVALIVAFFLGILNAIVRPILIILTLPINILTLGLFTLVINGLIFWFISSFVQGFEVDGFLSAVLGAALIWVISWAGNVLFQTTDTNAKRAHGVHPDQQAKNFYHVERIEKPDDKKK